MGGFVSLISLSLMDLMDESDLIELDLADLDPNVKRMCQILDSFSLVLNNPIHGVHSANIQEAAAFTGSGPFPL